MTFGSSSGLWVASRVAAVLLLFPGIAFSAESAAPQPSAQQQQPAQQDQLPGVRAQQPDQPQAAPEDEQEQQPPTAAQPSRATPSQPKPPGTVKSTHGAWSIVCDKPNGASNDQCGLIQDVVAEDRPEITLSVIVLNSADRKSKILRVRAPLNILLPNGLGLNIDGKDIGRVNFTRCFSDGCYAEAILEDALVKTLRTGKTATFILFQTPEEGIGIPVELKGFAEGYDALQ
ncbi:invasion associated locus B family protein [Neorhizobium sp. P12A]|uniref:invasion associated locus B family protein n=1 Tax=Neorhizobium sp. P12A TaxID=2268027 RepID=UPI0011EC9713|nr:invasion associated locus B family protein [Neorhizobium sp. P12A]KAA0699740.1 invasion associated locus B family protein [Neorhizobium sp. P12A]